MSRARAELKIILRDGKGRFSPLSRARNFEVFYGKRKLLTRTEFPARWRVAAKKEFVEELLLQFLIEQEAKRIERLETKKARAIKTEKRLPAKKRIKKIKKKINRKVVETEIEEYVRKVTAPRDLYKKEIIDKTIWSSVMERFLKLRTLDFTLAESIDVTLVNYRDNSLHAEIQRAFDPHIRKFLREEYRSSAKQILYRIKYEILQGVDPRNQGFGAGRLYYEEDPELLVRYMLIETMEDLFGGRQTMGRKPILNYLFQAKDHVVRVTGFTLEITKKEL